MHELARGHRSFGTDRSRPQSETRDALLAPRSVTIRRRHVDSGAVTVPPTVTIAAPPAATRRQ
jgi:hypothetical protein